MIEQVKMRRSSRETGQVMMRFVLRAIVFLAIAAGLGLVGVALFSDLPAPTREVTLPVEAK